jgi:hypothetical protein
MAGHLAWGLLGKWLLQVQVVHQGRDRSRVLGQPLEARRQEHTIRAFQFRETWVAQPVLHAAQGVEQVSQLSGHAVATRTQAQVADRPLHALRLQQSLARLLQEELFLLRTGAAKQVDDAARLRCRQRLPPCREQ